MIRASGRWLHSDQKKPEDGLETFKRQVRIELGELRYLLVAREFLVPVGVGEGGIKPGTGFHCVIERPDPVSRVAPPTSTHGEDQRRDREQPEANAPDVAGRRVGARGLQCRSSQNHSVPASGFCRGARLGIIARAAHDNSSRAFRKDRMSPRFRKLLGAFVMIAFVLVYALVAMALADLRPMHEAPAICRPSSTSCWASLGCCR